MLGRNIRAGHGKTAKENICLHAATTEGLSVAVTGFLGNIRFAVVFPVVSHNQQNVLNIATAQPPDHLPDMPLAHSKWIKMFRLVSEFSFRKMYPQVLSISAKGTPNDQGYLLVPGPDPAGWGTGFPAFSFRPRLTPRLLCFFPSPKPPLPQ